jgi:hypothetical protein
MSSFSWQVSHSEGRPERNLGTKTFLSGLLKGHNSHCLQQNQCSRDHGGLHQCTSKGERYFQKREKKLPEIVDQNAVVPGHRWPHCKREREIIHCTWINLWCCYSGKQKSEIQSLNNEFSRILKKNRTLPVFGAAADGNSHILGDLSERKRKDPEETNLNHGRIGSVHGGEHSIDPAHIHAGSSSHVNKPNLHNSDKEAENKQAIEDTFLAKGRANETFMTLPSSWLSFSIVMGSANALHKTEKHKSTMPRTKLKLHRYW